MQIFIPDLTLNIPDKPSYAFKPIPSNVFEYQVESFPQYKEKKDKSYIPMMLYKSARKYIDKNQKLQPATAEN